MDRCLKIVRRLGVARARDLDREGVYTEYLRRLRRRGIMTRTGRGLYTLAGAENVTENHVLDEACKLVRGGIICLYSDLRLHDIGTQNPSEVWVAIDRRPARPSRIAPRRKLAHNPKT